MNVFLNILKYKELLIRLAIKEIRVRYKEPVLGFLWALIVPLLVGVILLFVFTKIIKIPSQGYPFFIFLITGLFPWNFLGLSVSNSTMSILESGDMIKKVYFPKEIIPFSIVLANGINFMFTVLALMLFLVLLKIKLSLWILILPYAVLNQLILVLGLALLISGLQVVYRDIKFIVEVVMLLWFYMTPIFYPLSLVYNMSDKFFNVYAFLNPMVGITVLYRIAFIGSDYFNDIPVSFSLPVLLIVSLLSSMIIFILGYKIFNRHEARFADLVR